MTRPFRVATAVAAALAFLVPIVRSGPALAEDHRNEIKGLAFNPDQMTIRAGDSVTWVNGDSDRHNLQGDGFESKEMVNGQTFTVEFPEPGQIAYSPTTRRHPTAPRSSSWRPRPTRGTWRPG